MGGGSIPHGSTMASAPTLRHMLGCKLGTGLFSGTQRCWGWGAHPYIWAGLDVPPPPTAAPTPGWLPGPQIWGCSPLPVTFRPHVPVVLSVHPQGGPGLRSWCLAPCWGGASCPHGPPQLHLPLQLQVLALPPSATPAQGMGLLWLVLVALPGSGCSWKSLWEQGMLGWAALGWGGVSCS